MTSLQEYLEAGQTIISNLLLKNYYRLGMKNQEFLLWLQLYRLQNQGDLFPDLTVIAEDMGVTTDQIFQSLDKLESKNFLKIETFTDAQGKKRDRYNLSYTFEKLSILEEQDKFKTEQKNEKDSIKELYRSVEQEFGRPLSAIEFQRIGEWLEVDHYSSELIQLALREAVLSQAYNLNYIDRILLSWERKNIKTKQQVLEEQRKRKQLLMQKEIEQADTKKPLPIISIENWLDD
ncbi:DNA replication protein DnaD [Enterococcus sp. JM4C]|uniref:DnaD domain protein n=1 Tax=Candidatus Enterococcus huntleyi TaxID=1857217 RepID=UPI00137B68D1|nr:DnaD domain protein [Enterococcus sp. JM4C]KAF1296033.1 DNA replication protein DnaD [Enterococcus sp. JM4C]